MGKKMMCATVLLLAIALTEACHAGFKRRKRDANDHDVEAKQTEIFFRQCLTTLVSETPWKWQPITEFVVKYSDWFKKTGTVQCPSPSEQDAAECWKSAAKELLKKESGLLPAVSSCIDAYKGYGDLVEGVAGSSPDEELLEQLALQWVEAYFPKGGDHYKKGIASMDKMGCPVKSPEEYTKCMRNELQHADLNAGSLDYHVLSQFMDVEGDCEGPECDCSALYQPGTVTYEYFRAMGITCRDCWATRIAGFISKHPQAIQLRKAAIYCSSLLSGSQ